MKITSKEQLITMLKIQLSKRPSQAIKGLLRVYENQTSSEQANGEVHFNNGIGFVPTDAYILSSFAAQYKSKGKLSEKQMAILFKKMPKYAKQLIDGSISAGKIYKSCGEYLFS